MLHKGYTKFIMPAGIMSSASISIIRSNPIISADLFGLSVICSFIIRMNPVYDKTDGGLNGFHRSISLNDKITSIFKNIINKMQEGFHKYIWIPRCNLWQIWQENTGRNIKKEIKNRSRYNRKLLSSIYNSNFIKCEGDLVKGSESNMDTFKKTG